MFNTETLDQAVEYSTKRINKSDVSLMNYVTTDNLLQNKLGITKAVNLPPQDGNLPKFERDNILISNIRPYLKKIWFSNIIGGCSADVLVFDVKKKYHPKFIYYTMFRDDFFEHMMRGSKGTKMPRGDKNQILDFKIPVIKHSNQQTIANVLSSLDTKIELNNKINTELEAMAKTLYDYWFVQFDFPNDQGKPYKSSSGKMVYNEELKKEIPEGWGVFQLSSLLKHNYSSITKNDFYEKFEYLDTSSLTANVINGTQLIIPGSEKVPSRAKRVVNANDILYSTVRPNLCHYGIIKHPTNEMIASTGFIQLSAKKDWVSNDLIYTYLVSEWVTQRLHQIASLSVSSYPSISPNDILDLKIPLPKGGKILEFINLKFDAIYKMESTNQLENKKLADLRDWLLPMLLNGQVSVE